MLRRFIFFMSITLVVMPSFNFASAKAAKKGKFQTCTNLRACVIAAIGVGAVLGTGTRFYVDQQCDSLAVTNCGACPAFTLSGVRISKTSDQFATLEHEVEMVCGKSTNLEWVPKSGRCKSNEELNDDIVSMGQQCKKPYDFIVEDRFAQPTVQKTAQQKYDEMMAKHKASRMRG